MMFVVMGVGLALYLGGIAGVLYAKSRTGVVASAMVFGLGCVLYFGPLLGVN
jgi:hypothetical protein